MLRRLCPAALAATPGLRPLLWLTITVRRRRVPRFYATNFAPRLQCISKAVAVKIHWVGACWLHRPPKIKDHAGPASAMVGNCVAQAWFGPIHGPGGPARNQKQYVLNACCVPCSPSLRPLPSLERPKKSAMLAAAQAVSAQRVQEGRPTSGILGCPGSFWRNLLVKVRSAVDD